MIPHDHYGARTGGDAPTRKHAASGTVVVPNPNVRYDKHGQVVVLPSREQRRARERAAQRAEHRAQAERVVRPVARRAGSARAG